MSRRRQAQKNWEPIIPDYMVLPHTKRTERRIVRASLRELNAVPKPKAILHSVEQRKPEPLSAKLIRLGWQDEQGRGLDWKHWNKFQPCYAD